MDNYTIYVSFLLHELDLEVTHYNGTKSLRTDEFNSYFWEDFGINLGKIWELCLIRSLYLPIFHKTSPLILTLIPKVESLSQHGDFRHISLVGSLYKLVSKVLQTILANEIDALIYRNQLNLFKGRLLVDWVVEVNELIALEKISNKHVSLLR